MVLKGPKWPRLLIRIDSNGRTGFFTLISAAKIRHLLSRGKGKTLCLLSEGLKSVRYALGVLVQAISLENGWHGWGGVDVVQGLGGRCFGMG